MSEIVLKQRNNINMTPRETVAELDKHIIGQNAAKKAVAVSLRNRWRRLRLNVAVREEVTPKNILMIGTTGVGKTEVARRLAKLTHSPFIKVEASKFTEVGYVGRDVESMIRDLVEVAFNIVRNEMKEEIAEVATQRAENTLLDLLLLSKSTGYDERGSELREKFRTMLHDGSLEAREIEVNVEESGPHLEVFSNMGMEEMGMNLQDALKNIMPGRKKSKKMKVSEARAIIYQQETEKLLDMTELKSRAVKRASESGIIFIDEIDKVCQSGGMRGGDVSREGVQRDLLPIVEGSTVPTKYGLVNTDHILFIAAGAFSLAKPSDLLPELQGRFPIRVELDNLTKSDFVRILTEPENSLIKQYIALLAEDGVNLIFEEKAIEAVAEYAFQMNESIENIGARRLHTMLEKLLEDILFDAPECARGDIKITGEYVFEKLEKIVNDKQSRTYIL